MGRTQLGMSLGAVCFFGLQLFGPHTSTVTRANPEWSLWNNADVPAPVFGILKKACLDCHSNQTRWPWYSRIAPLSWAIHHDVKNARKAFNVDEWAVQAGRKPGIAAGTLIAICGDLKSRRMPLKQYTLLHPEARLSAAEIQTVCTWTAEESARYLKRKKPTSSQKVYNLPTTAGIRPAYDRHTN